MTFMCVHTKGKEVIVIHSTGVFGSIIIFNKTYIYRLIEVYKVILIPALYVIKFFTNIP